MAAREHREAQRLSSFSIYIVFFLLISGLFVQNSCAFTSYTRHELLDIGLRIPGSYISNIQLVPEIARTPDATHPTRPGGSGRRRRRDRKQRRGKRGGLRARLKLTPHRLSLPSIFLANVRSLVNKMDEIRLRIINNKRLLNCNVIIFTETWLHSGIPDNAIELAGYNTHRADRTAEESEQQTEKKKKKGVRACFKKGWRAMKGSCSCTQSNDLDPSEQPYLPVLNPVVLADTADRPGCAWEQTPLEDPIDPQQDPSGLKQNAPQEPTDDRPEQQTEGKKKKGVRARFKRGWGAMKRCCTRNNKVVPLLTQSDLDPVDPQPAPEDPQPAPEDPQPAPEDPQPTPEDPQAAPEDPQPTPEDPQAAPEDPAKRRPEQQTEGKKKKKGVRARFKRGWGAMKRSCARNNKVVLLPTQSDLDPVDPQPAPEDPQPAPEDPQPAPQDPQPAPEDPAEHRPEGKKKKKGVRARFKKGWQAMKRSCARTRNNKVVLLPTQSDLDPVDPRPAPEDPRPAPEDPQPAPEDPQPAPQVLKPVVSADTADLPCEWEWREQVEAFHQSLSNFDPNVQRILCRFPPKIFSRFPPRWICDQPFLDELDEYKAFSALYEAGRKNLGKGHKGIVYEGTRRSDGLKVAIKFRPKLQSWDKYIHIPGYDEPLYSEVALNLLLQKPEKCPNIVELLDWFEEGDIYILVLEYPYPCLTMTDFIRYENLSENQARHLMRQALNAVQHCIDHDVCHGSLEIRNVLINVQTMTLMLIDFGCGDLASTWGKPDPDHPDRGSGRPDPTWFEPDGESYGRAHAVADMVYSLGKLLLYMMGGYRVISYFNPVKKDSPEIKELGLTEECLDLINRCKFTPPPDRPTLEEFRDHEWFKQG